MDDLICKFVYVDGKEVGESVDVYKKRLVIKVGGEFLAIPVEKIMKVEDDKIHVFKFDENSARKFGQEWVDEKSKPVSLEELKIFGFSERDVVVDGVGEKETLSGEKETLKQTESSKFSVKVKEIGDSLDKEDEREKEIESDKSEKENSKKIIDRI